jgi:hypothetical protein
MTNKPTYPLPNPADPTGLSARPVFDPTNPGKYAGQDRAGESGLTSRRPVDTYGQIKYGQPQPQSDARPKRENTPDAAPSAAPAAADESAKDIPKTG